jgi:hypothetical protein
LQAVPDSLLTIDPTEADKFFPAVDLERFEKAVKEIVAASPGHLLNRSQALVERGQVIRPHIDTWLSDGKLEERIRRILFKHHLAIRIKDPSPQSLRMPCLQTGKRAVSLSHIADRIARIGLTR